MLPQKKLHTQNINILLIEDSETDAYVITKLLLQDVTKEDKIRHATNMKDARKFLDESNKPDLILSDLMLPDTTDQDDTIEQLRPYMQNTPVIVLSNNDEESIGAKIIENGAEDFISKSKIIIAPETLCQSIDFSIHRHANSSIKKESKANELKKKNRIIKWITNS